MKTPLTERIAALLHKHGHHEAASQLDRLSPSDATPCSQFLPCPFCGSENIEVMYDDGYNVGCKDCSTYVAPFLGAAADDKQKHIDFWNTRAPISSANVQAHLRATKESS